MGPHTAAEEDCASHDVWEDETPRACHTAMATLHELYYVRNTFIDVADPDRDSAREGRPRARSAGAEPARGSLPIKQWLMTRLPSSDSSGCETAAGCSPQHDGRWGSVVTPAAGLPLLEMAANQRRPSSNGSDSTPLSASPKDGRLNSLTSALLTGDASLDTILASSPQGLAASLDNPRVVMRTLWALGKADASPRAVEAVVEAAGRTTPAMLHKFTSTELSISLWGLARAGRACGGGSSSRKAVQLALAIVAEAATRVSTFTAQCLSNSLWAVAKLELRGAAADQFANACVAQIRATVFVDMTPQGFANCLWAVAKLQADPAVAVPFCTEAARHAATDPGGLSAFMPQELSMALWGMAKVVGRRATRGRGHGSSSGHIEAFAIRVAEEASRRLSDLSAQGLSNIAWSLATLEVTRAPAARDFVIAASTMAGVGLDAFTPQAIANFCWALGRFENVKHELAFFAAAAAREATRREAEFTWQDLAGIISAVMHADLGKVPEVRNFACLLVQRATFCCWDMGTQALLNIALAATRLGVEPQVLQPMAWGIGEVFASRTLRLNDIDHRQWVQVQRYCGLPCTSAWEDWGNQASVAGAKATRGRKSRRQ